MGDYDVAQERITTEADGPDTVNERLSTGGPGPEGQEDTVTERLSGEQPEKAIGESAAPDGEPEDDITEETPKPKAKPRKRTAKKS